MLLDSLPTFARCILLFVVGAAGGALINLAVYQLAIFRPRKISPWSSAQPGTPRSWSDRVPIFGWLGLRRESAIHGRGHWIRPMIIETGCAVGLVYFYWWQADGGLYGGDARGVVGLIGNLGMMKSTWFLFHAVLFALLAIATFIDLDEQTIPDWITIPGTVFALCVALIAPLSRLPIVESLALGGGIELAPLTLASPEDPVAWIWTWMGPLVGLLVVLVWCVALMPMTQTLRYGWRRGLVILWASVLRPPRRTRCALPREPRRMFASTKLLLALAPILVVLLVTARLLGGAYWTSFLGSLLGLAVGGGIVWAVRIIASHALATEAMGFGDVTLMCMVGAFLGWQPALLVFVFSPFMSIVVALAQLVTSGKNKLAFGPYLCLSAVVLIVGWNAIWNHWASTSVFGMGHVILLTMIGASLVLMFAMLGAWAIFKRKLTGSEQT